MAQLSVRLALSTCLCVGHLGPHSFFELVLNGTRAYVAKGGRRGHINPTESKRIMEWDRKLILIKMTNRVIWDFVVQSYLSKNSS